VKRTVMLVLIAVMSNATDVFSQERPRVREIGLEIGYLSPGESNAITDVPGVSVGHATVIEGDSIRTGVTAVVPHQEDVFAYKVPGAVHVANGFGKLVGTTQIDELGTIETPIVLTNTVATFRAADALVRWTLDNTTSEDVRSVNPVVGETNDGFLNAITVPRIGAAEVREALSTASSGPVEEGSVGAGTGTSALGFKGGIGTSSRRVRIGPRTYTVGVLVQSNFGGALEIVGVKVGQALGTTGWIDPLRPSGERTSYDYDRVPDAAGGSIMIVVATDAPVDAFGLGRLAARAPYAIGRVGGPSTHGSGDYVIAFSTAEGLRTPYEVTSTTLPREALRGEALSPLFLAVIEATEEAILNSLFRATTVVGWRGTREALPVERVAELLAEAGVLRP